MKNKFPLSDKEFSLKYKALIKPMSEANTAHMYALLQQEGIKAIIKEARKELKISSRGRKPNSEKAYYQEIGGYKNGHSILLSTTTFNERNVINKYVDRILFEFNVYEHFKDSFAIYIVHNLVFAPDHNVEISFRILNKGKSVLPDIHFYRMPYKNDWKLAELFIERNTHIQKNFINRLPVKFKTSYRGKKNLTRDMGIIKEASNRDRVSQSRESLTRELYKISNAEIAEIKLGDIKKETLVKKILNRNKARVKELASTPR